MTIKLTITSINKIQNEQKRYAKYLQLGNAFEVGLQELGADAKASSEPVYVCRISNKDGEILVQDLTDNGIFINGKQVQQAVLKDNDLVWLTDSVHLFFRIYLLTGKDLFKSSPTSRAPIIIPVLKAEKKGDKVQDYSDPIGHEIAGYVFESKLEQGAMGIVYKGIQKSLKRPVAIKTVAPKNLNNPTLIKRFMNMANLAWRLNHPYIVQIYDTGVSREFKLHYVVMEYVEGRTLREVLNEKKRLEVDYACKIMSQLASALSFAHRQSIVHRDVNPTNIIITKDDYIKLVGLALSKILDPEEEQLYLTKAGQAMGTLGYISPEQLKSAADVDFRTDIYSMGVIFYECLCGKLPYDPQVLKDPAKYVKALRRRPQEAPHNIVSHIPENLSQIVMKCLEPSPDKRYQKAEEVLADIKVYTEVIQLSTAQKRIRAMFPKTPQIEGFDLHVSYEPMEEIGGDFYDFVPLGDGKWGIVIGDVTGHGVEAAVVMGMIKSVVKVMAKRSSNAAEVLEQANKEVSPDMDNTTFTTVAYGILDTVNKTFSYSRAGHNPMLLYNSKRDPALITYTPKGTILGVPWPLNCDAATIDLLPGDVLLQYTDGITEAKSKTSEEFGMERLCEVMEQFGNRGASALATAIKQSVAEFTKGSTEDEDDVTLVIVHYKE